MLAFRLNLIFLWMIILIMHSKTDIRYRSMGASFLWAFDRLVVILLGKVPGHVILPSLIMGLVVDGTLVEVLGQGLLLVIDFTAPSDWTWKVINSFLWKLFFSLFIIFSNNILRQ